jgi:hypothetical protein
VGVPPPRRAQSLPPAASRARVSAGSPWRGGADEAGGWCGGGGGGGGGGGWGGGGGGGGGPRLDLRRQGRGACGWMT